MRIDILTLFPDTMRAMLGESILGRAQARGLLDIRCHQIRDYTENRQKQVDDLSLIHISEPTRPY